MSGLIAGGSDWAGSELAASSRHADQERLTALDGLRAIAVLTVLLSHTSGRDQALGPQLDFLGIGHVGVYLFFVLSAFLLGLGLLNSGITAQSVRNFYLRRIFRIIPLYYLVIGSVFLQQHLTGQISKQYLHIEHGWTGFWQHLAMYRGDSVFWSVVVEMQFYLVVPFLVWLLLRFRWKGLLGLLLAGIVNEMFYVASFIAPDWDNPIRWLSPNNRENGTYLGLFALGLAAGYAARFHRDRLRHMQDWLHPVATAAFFSLMLLTLTLVSRDFLGFERPYYNFRFFSLLYAVVFSLFVLSVYLGNPLCTWLKSSALRLWGVFGFSVYLLHMPVLALLNTTGLPPLAKACFSFIAVFGLSAATYFAVERPFIRWSYRITREGRSGLHLGQSIIPHTR